MKQGKSSQLSKRGHCQRISGQGGALGVCKGRLRDEQDEDETDGVDEERLLERRNLRSRDPRRFGVMSKLCNHDLVFLSIPNISSLI